MENIQSNTSEIIKIDTKFIKDIENLKIQYHKIKKTIFHEIINEIMNNK